MIFDNLLTGVKVVEREFGTIGIEEATTLKTIRFKETPTELSRAFGGFVAIEKL